MMVRKRTLFGVVFSTVVIMACINVFDVIMQNSRFIVKFSPKPLVNLFNINNQLCFGNGIKPLFPMSTKMLSHLEFQQEKFEFLKNFKNPCFYRNITFHNNKPIKTSVNALRCLPYFIIVGQPKCGTTDIWEGLTLHPDVAANHPKETGYFSSRRFPPYNWTFDKYLDVFHNTTATIVSHPSPDKWVGGEVYYNQITGDGAVEVSTFNDDWYLEPGNDGCNEPRVLSAHFIRHINPNTKLIMTIRNPVDRVYSNYIYTSQQLGEAISITDFHHNVLETIKNHTDCRKYFSQRGCAYNSSIETHRARLRVGMYHVFIEDWLRVFPVEQLKIIHFETFTKQRLSVMKEIFKFLDLRPLSVNEEKKQANRYIANQRSKKGKKLGEMMNETRTILENFYAPFNERLATLLNDKRFLWRN